MTSARQPVPASPTDGFLLVDKPADWTSHDVVARLRRLLGTRKIGHAGTLDPMATGLLVLGVNRATRLLHYVVGANKTYSATMRLGQDTTTDDAEGTVTTSRGARAITPAAIEGAADNLRGDIQQVPAAVSAIKVDGRRAYARVRQGETVELPPRPVHVSQFDIIDHREILVDDIPVIDLDVIVTCSAGTYVRALARDLGAAMGTGGHLTALRRTHFGPFDVAEAHTVAELAEQAEGPQGIALMDPATVARRAFPIREVTVAEARALSYGQAIPAATPHGTPTRPVAALDPDGRLLALLADEQGKARPVLVLRPA